MASKEVISLIVILLSFNAYALSYSVDLVIHNDRAEIDNIKVTGAMKFDQGSAGSHSISLYDGQNNIIHAHHFTPNFVTTDHPPRDLDKTYESFRLPFDPRAKVLVLTRGSDILLTQNNIDRMVCNDDGICDSNENAISCLNDCRSGVNDGFCDGMLDQVCDPDCCDPVCSQSLDPDCRIDSKIALDCGNGICDDIETYLTCPADCQGAADGLCDGIGDGLCDPDCLTDEDIDCMMPVVKPDNISQEANLTELADPLPEIDLIENNTTYQTGKIGGNVWAIILISVLVLAGVLIMLNKDNFFHRKVEGTDVVLEDYILKNLKAGYTKDQILGSLIRHGYSAKKVEDILRRL